MKKTLLVSVGGSPAPIIYSINQQKPDYLIFYASYNSRQTAVEEILPGISCKPKDYEFIMTEDEQNLEKSVAALLSEIPKKLKIWGLDYNSLSADYTGGTKTMSAAVVLTLSNHINKFSYVGGALRDKDGLGIVKDGHEQMLHLNNPWNELAINHIKEIEILFNKCRFVSAEEKAEICKNVSTARSRLFEAIQYCSKAFALWDNFQHKSALNELSRGDALLERIASESNKTGVVTFAKDIKVALSVLQKVCDKNRSDSLIIDIIANAVRRGEIEHKYDDATARLYSAIEKLAKIRLKSTYNIDNSDVQEGQLPESIKAEIVLECKSERDQKIQIPLHKSYLLLAALKDEIGIKYLELAEELGKILTIRNSSILAHGFEPVKKETYLKLLEITMKFIGISKTELPQFPILQITDGGL